MDLVFGCKIKFISVSNVGPGNIEHIGSSTKGDSDISDEEDDTIENIPLATKLSRKGSASSNKSSDSSNTPNQKIEQFSPADSSVDEDNHLEDIPLARKVSTNSAASLNKSIASSESPNVSHSSLIFDKYSSKENNDKISISSAEENVISNDSIFQNNDIKATCGSEEHSRASSVSSVQSSATKKSSVKCKISQQHLDISSRDVSTLDVETSNIVESSYVTIYKDIASSSDLDSTLKVKSESNESIEKNEDENREIEHNDVIFKIEQNTSKTTSVSSIDSEALRSSTVSEKSTELENVDSLNDSLDKPKCGFQVEPSVASLLDCMKSGDSNELKDGNKSQSNESISKKEEPGLQIKLREMESTNKGQ